MNTPYSTPNSTPSHTPNPNAATTQRKKLKSTGGTPVRTNNRASVQEPLEQPEHTPSRPGTPSLFGLSPIHIPEPNLEPTHDENTLSQSLSRKRATSAGSVTPDSSPTRPTSSYLDHEEKRRKEELTRRKRDREQNAQDAMNPTKDNSEQPGDKGGEKPLADGDAGDSFDRRTPEKEDNQQGPPPIAPLSKKQKEEEERKQKKLAILESIKASDAIREKSDQERTTLPLTPAPDDGFCDSPRADKGWILDQWASELGTGWTQVHGGVQSSYGSPGPLAGSVASR
ncbi:hypothetical protein HWV62_3562 [Athelia sp. TMB]|nr:hypothetical protein HWV62_3562 [Athelia sp. TMB]